MKWVILVLAFGLGCGKAEKTGEKDTKEVKKLTVEELTVKGKAGEISLSAVKDSLILSFKVDGKEVLSLSAGEKLAEMRFKDREGSTRMIAAQVLGVSKELPPTFIWLTDNSKMPRLALEVHQDSTRMVVQAKDTASVGGFVLSHSKDTAGAAIMSATGRLVWTAPK